MSFWCKGEILCELRVAKKRLNTFYYIPTVEVKGLSPDDKLAAFERRASRQAINLLIELFDGVVRESKFIYDL